MCGQLAHGVAVGAIQATMRQPSSLASATSFAPSAMLRLQRSRVLITNTFAMPVRIAVIAGYASVQLIGALSAHHVGNQRYKLKTLSLAIPPNLMRLRLKAVTGVSLPVGRNSYVAYGFRVSHRPLPVFGGASVGRQRPQRTLVADLV